MQLVSPILNDALSLLNVTGTAFIQEFDAADASERRWVARRSALPGLDRFNLTARRMDGVIVAEARLAAGFFLDETSERGLIRVPVPFPDTVDIALPGRAIGVVLEHPLTGRATSLIQQVTVSADGRERLISYLAGFEPLR